MLEPPDLPAEHIMAAVSRQYGFTLATLAFLPLGLDVQAAAYRAVTADGASYFLKLRRGDVNPVSLRVPRALADAAAARVVAPLRALTGLPWARCDGFTLALFPFINGVNGMVHGLQQRHWIALGAALRAVHDAPLPPDLALEVPRETFTLMHLFQRLRQTPWVDVVAALETHGTRRVADAAERDLAEFWRERRLEIRALADQFEALGERLRAAGPALVLCHADVHPNNVLIDMDGQIWIVDWDEVLYAPKECDLMMGVGGLGNYPAGPVEAAWFLHGYGSTAIDPIALAFYRHARALGDLGVNAEEVLRATASPAARHAAMQRLRQLFTPGYIVALARQGERSG